MGGRPGEDLVDAFVPTRNADASAKTYSIGPDGFLAADRVLGPLGFDVIGVMHSHTHTDPYPSPTDIAQAKWYPDWVYVLVSLKYDTPSLRAYRIVDGTVHEVRVALDRG
jgi:proteasome lid subunit RPN8/RPN11